MGQDYFLTSDGGTIPTVKRVAIVPQKCPNTAKSRGKGGDGFRGNTTALHEHGLRQLDQRAGRPDDEVHGGLVGPRESRGHAEGQGRTHGTAAARPWARR